MVSSTGQFQKGNGESSGGTGTTMNKEAAGSGGQMSWAMRLAKTNGGDTVGNEVDETNRAKASGDHGDSVVSGVRLPAGVSAASSQSSIKFGSIDPEQLDGKEEMSGKLPTVVNPSVAPVNVPRPPPEPRRAGPHGGRGNRGNSMQSHIQGSHQVPGMGQGPYGGTQQFGLPYGQPYQGLGQIQGQYQPYMQAPNFYPSSFRQQMGGAYYGGSVMPIGTPEGGQQIPPPPSNMGTGAASFTPSPGIVPKPAPVREKKILRIEDPDTHEALDLKEITNTSRAKKAEEDEKRAQEEKEIGKDDKKRGEEEVKQELASATFADRQNRGTDNNTSEKELHKLAIEDNGTPAEKKDIQTTRQTESPKERDVMENFDEEPVEEAIQDSGIEQGSRKTYTRDFLLSLRDKCKDLPHGLEPATLSALFSRQNERSFQERGDWKSNRSGPPPPPRGRGPSRQRSAGPESDTWERGKPLPPMPGFGGRGAPPPGMRMPSGPLPALHKSSAAYKVGKTKSDDPEEEASQKALKSMLNKITPENFNKITEQIIAKINERKKAKTLQGFINQIFDKALKETTFAELYANLVSKLNPALPDLHDDDGNPVNFRRALLNKCQEEFDYGVNAMKAVAAREKRQQEEADESEDLEEGEMTEDQKSRIQSKAEQKQKDKAAAEAEVKARKRMLGNIIFVGQLYRFGVLIEAVMHSCIKQLLEETEHPRPEDVECLCKLLTTVGRPMDNSKREIKRADGSTIKTSDMMEVYFRRIETLIKSKALDARHSFMLQDLVDLRKDSWVERRKSEGPKKIGDIHRDAAMERSRSQQLDRQSSKRGERGPPQRPAFDTRVDAPIRAMSTKQVADPSSLRPGGRPGPPPRQSKPAPPVKVTEKLSEEAINRRVKGLLEELYHNQDIKEGLLAIRELKDGGAKMESTFDLIMSSSLEGKGTEWDILRNFLLKLRSENLIEDIDLQKGARSLLDKLEDVRVDVPKAPHQVATVFAFLVANNCMSLQQLLTDLREADMEVPPEGEDTMMVDSGTAKVVLGVLLSELKNSSGEGLSNSLKEVDLVSFFPGYERKDADAVSNFVEKFGLHGLF